mmetsp:Transcript_24216/g.36306  ORF Transcript_24216/g.36306 Transcript_24216/m.36306 type:complete len:107 (+) Transcript_24216:228-548(+)
MPIVGNLIEITVELDKFLAAEGVATLFKRSVYLALEQTCQNNLNNDQGRTKELFQSKNSQKCDLGNVEPNDDSIKDQGEQRASTITFDRHQIHQPESKYDFCNCEK